MEKQLNINIEESLIEEVTKLLDKIGLDISTVVKVLIKRLVREQSVSFLLSDNAPIKTINQPVETNTTASFVSNNENKANVNIQNVAPYTNLYSTEKGDMTKSKAIIMFRNSGVSLNKNITFASKNRGAYNYWANPEFGMLKYDWYIILNDWLKRELHLFLIPANSINASELTPRNDKEYLIDLQIMYNDNAFRDNRSGFCFAKYLIKQIIY